jgi:signal recognition particle receptor subunit alpha
MVQILTPKKRIDILRDAYEAQRQKRPYVIVFCGVNGVGKSTNLAKVTFWLIENSFRGKIINFFKSQFNFIKFEIYFF